MQQNYVLLLSILSMPRAGIAAVQWAWLDGPVFTKRTFRT